MIHAKATANSSHRVLANALDALVRSARSQAPQTASVAARVVEAWHGAGDVQITLEAEAVSVGDERALVADTERGAWILPAFMAGLHGVRPTGGADGDRLHALAFELASLKPSTEVITRFRDWLWADGAEGFDIDVRSSFMEMIDSVAVELPWRNPAWMLLREEASSAFLPAAVTVASRELDAAAYREEFQAPLELYANALVGGDDAAAHPSFERLRDGSDDAADWTQVETDLALERLEVRQALPPTDLARRLVACLSERADAAMLDVFVKACTLDDDYSRRILAALESSGVGARAARALVFDDEGILAPLAGLLRLLSTAERHGFVCALLGRGDDEPAQVKALVAALGEERLLSCVTLDALSTVEAVALARCLANSRQGAHLLRSCVEHMTPACTFSIIMVLPPAIIASILPTLRRHLLQASSDQFDSAVALLCSIPDTATLRLVGDVLSETHGRSGSPSTIALACQALVEVGLGETCLVPLARSSQASVVLRLAALEALRSSRALLTEAARWRVAEVADPPEVRNKLREIRDQLRQAAHA